MHKISLGGHLNKNTSLHGRRTTTTTNENRSPLMTVDLTKNESTPCPFFISCIRNVIKTSYFYLMHIQTIWNVLPLNMDFFFTSKTGFRFISEGSGKHVKNNVSRMNERPNSTSLNIIGWVFFCPHWCSSKLKRNMILHRYVTICFNFHAINIIF